MKYATPPRTVKYAATHGQVCASPAMHFRAKLKNMAINGQQFGGIEVVKRKIRQRKANEAAAPPEALHVLIDYRNGNEQLKKSNLSRQEAESRNEILKGSGMAWARISA